MLTQRLPAFLCSVFILLSVQLSSQIVIIVGPSEVCRQKKESFSVDNPVAGHNYFWSVDTGAVVLQPIGISTTVLFNHEVTSVTLTVTEKDANGSVTAISSKEIPVKNLPNPIIITNVRVGCEKLDEPDPENPSSLFLDDGKCHKVCANSIVQYSANETMGTTYNWVVNGGTIIGANNGVTVQVQWGG